MSLNDNINPLNSWLGTKKPVVIAGPCSAETREQLMETAIQLKKFGVDAIRAGIWKPRTRPNSFEGIGVEGLKWMQDVKKELNIPVATEVASALHVEVALKYGIDILWIGARTTVSPFAVQEIADAMRGVDTPILVKNPINPELALWIGALERLNQAGVKNLGAIHRGFSSFDKTKFRNVPNWQIAIELRRQFPNIPLICDPSHIGGKRELIYDISQRALDLGYDGLIIESHRNPHEAWSDAEQQVTPESLGNILHELKVKSVSSDNVDFVNHLDELRRKINNVDRELVEVLAARMALVEKIGEYKKENNVTTLQVERVNEIFKTRKEWGAKMNLNEAYIDEIFKTVHEESVRKQEEIINSLPAEK